MWTAKPEFPVFGDIDSLGITGSICIGLAGSVFVFMNEQEERTGGRAIAAHITKSGHSCYRVAPRFMIGHFHL